MKIDCLFYFSSGRLVISLNITISGAIVPYSLLTMLFSSSISAHSDLLFVVMVDIQFVVMVDIQFHIKFVSTRKKCLTATSKTSNKQITYEK